MQMKTKIKINHGVVVQINTNNTTEIKDVGNRIVGVIKVIGIIVSVAILIVLGIKYMMGSAEEKATYKKTLVPYLVGAILIFAASTLADTIYNWVTGINS